MGKWVLSMDLPTARQNANMLPPVIHHLLYFSGYLKSRAFVPVVPSWWNGLPSPLSHYPAPPSVCLVPSDFSRWNSSDTSSGSLLSLPYHASLQDGVLMHGSQSLQYLCKPLVPLTRLNLGLYLFSLVCDLLDSRDSGWSSPPQYLEQSGCSINCLWVNE